MHVRICVRKLYAQKLAYEISWIARLVRRANMRHHAKCCADRSNRCRDIVIFKFLGCRLPRSWISVDLKFVTDQTVTRAKLRPRAKCRWNRWNCGRDTAIFSMFQNGGGRHVGFLKLQSSDYEMHRKCRIASPFQILWRLVKPLSRYRDFAFFKMMAATILDFLNFTF